ncbi:MAG: hypothetical protein PHH60_02505 [Candidatus Margulisbacteria bacterium]|nr:hypothetical protein [Candidatus Margulisiibacteriota bacterium]
MQLGLNRVSMVNGARRLAARLSIALAAASCGPSTPLFKAGLQPEISYYGERVIISGTRDQILKRLFENPAAYFQTGTVRSEELGGDIKGFAGHLASDLTINLSPDATSLTFKEGTRFLFSGEPGPSNDMIFCDGCEINGILAREAQFTIADIKIVVKAGEQISIYDDGINLPLDKETNFMLNGQKITFRAGFLTWKYNDPIVGRLARDTEFILNGNKIVFSGGTADKSFLFKIRSKGIPAEGTLVRDTEIDGMLYAGAEGRLDPGEGEDPIYSSIRLNSFGRVEEGILARAITEEGVTLLPGERICHTGGGTLSYQHPLFPDKKLTVPLMCHEKRHTDRGYTFAGGILMAGIKLPVAAFMDCYPSLAGKVEDYASYLPPLKIKRGKKLDRINIVDILDILRQHQDLNIPPNAVKIFFDEEENPRKIEFHKDVKINQEITIASGQSISLDITVIPAIFRGMVTSTIVDLLSQANPGLVAF